MNAKKSDVRLVLMMAGLGLLVLGGFFGVMRYRLHARRMKTQQALARIVEALDYYSDAYDHLPSAQAKVKKGKALFSWRFLLLPFGEAQSLPNIPFDFDLPWNAEINQSGAARVYEYQPLARCFTDPTRTDQTIRFAAIVGPGTAFDGDSPYKWTGLPPFTIVVAEVRNSPVHWMQPGGDLDVRTMSHEIGVPGGESIAGIDSEGFFVGFADGEVWMLSYAVPFERLEPFFLVEKARTADRQELLGPFRIRP